MPWSLEYAQQSLSEPVRSLPHRADAATHGQGTRMRSAADSLYRCPDGGGLGRGRAQPAFRSFVVRSVDASAQALKAIGELSDLMETSFAGREVKLVENLIDELERIEHDTDEMQIKLRAALYQREAVLPPVDVMFTYQVIEWIGDVADRAERVGNRLGIIMAR